MSVQCPESCFRTRVEPASLYVLAWLPVFLYSLYLKFVLLEWDGFRIFARQIGRLKLADLSLLEKALFFSSDVSVGGVFAPVLIFSFALVAPRIVRELGVAVICVSTALIMFIQNQSFYGLGTFTSFEMFSSSMDFVLLHPQEFSNYIQAKSLVKFAVLLAAIVFPIWFGARVYAGKSGFLSRKVAFGAPFVLLGGVLAAQTALWIAPTAPNSKFHKSALATAVSTFFRGDIIDTSKFENWTSEELLNEYRRLTFSPSGTSASAYFGKAKGYDVLLFVIETLPASFLDLSGELGELPTLRRLKKQSFIGAQHYSTYPYTNRALFSLLSSLYPSTGRKGFLNQQEEYRLPGIARSLANIGYRTQVFSPSDLKFEGDDALFRALGFQHHQFPTECGTDEKYWQEVKDMDCQALDLLKKEIAHLAGRSERYAAIFLPQISHGPWPDISEHQNVDDFKARGDNLLALQDSWLGEIVSVLEKNKRLEKTIIVVTSDHGFRTRMDYPEFSGGAIDDISFHVPLLIYAPGVLAQPEIVPWITSHIDIAPTVLDLLGAANSRELEQGLGIWESELEKRRVFFFGDYYLGADGFGSRGKFYMWNRLFNRMLTADALTFDTIDSTREASAEEARRARSVINRMNSLQHAIAERLM